MIINTDNKKHILWVSLSSTSKEDVAKFLAWAYNNGYEYGYLENTACIFVPKQMSLNDVKLWIEQELNNA